MTTYDLGDAVNLRYLATNGDGAPVVATVTLAIVDLATGSTVATPSVSTPTLGQYDAAYQTVATGAYAYVWTVTGAVADVATGTFTVATAGPATYSNLPAVKSQLGKVTSDDRDENIVLALVAASRMIDASTGRGAGAFQADRVATVRTFTASGRTYPGPGYARTAVMVDDMATTSGVVVESGTSATATYATLSGVTFGPDNAVANGYPINVLYVASSALYTADSIRVTARWGWPSIPAEVEMATRLLAARLYKRKESPQGVIASADWGAVRVSRTDPDVYALIAHLSIPGFA